MAENERPLLPTVIINTSGIDDVTKDFDFSIVTGEGGKNLKVEDVLMVLIYAAADTAGVPDYRYYDTINRVLDVLFEDDTEEN